MKFKCNQQTLSKALNTVSKAVSNRTTLPVLKGILLEATEDGKLTFTASDLEISIKKQIEVEVIEPGSVVVIAKLFNDIVRKLPNEDILMEEKENNSIEVKTNSSEFTLVGLPVDEFPNITMPEEISKKISFDKELFTEMVKKTAFSATTDESKGVLTGILTEIKEDSINMVSLDGFRLALVTEQIKSNEENKFIISAKIMNEISKIIMDEDNEASMEISLGLKNAVFNIGSTEVILRVMEGEFIKYRDIIPADSTTKIVIGKEIFADSIERASLLAKEGKNNLIKMSIKDNTIVITSRSEEGNVREEIPVEKEGDNIDIGFNSKFIIDVLKVIDDERFTMNLKTAVSPCVIRPVEGNAYEYLILPVRIPNM